MSGRTFLFAPGSDKKKTQKAIVSEADVIILDLEDAVALSEKVQARENIMEILTNERTKPIFVRINALSTPWALQDLLSVVPLNPDGLVLPKTESDVDVKKVCWIIDQLLGEEGGIGVYPLIETACGVEEVVTIARASKRVKRLIFGALDYSLDIGLSYTGDSSTYYYARARLVAASAIAGLEGPVDTVYPAFKDEEGLRQDTLEGKKIGFKGKLVIHPTQIALVNKLFTPTSEEYEEARQIVGIYLQAQAEGRGAIQWKGKMLDEPVLKRAQQVMKLIIGREING